MPIPLTESRHNGAIKIYGGAMKYSKGSTAFTLSLPTEMRDKLNELAEERGESRNGIVVRAIALELRKAGKMEADGRTFK